VGGLCLVCMNMRACVAALMKVAYAVGMFARRLSERLKERSRAYIVGGYWFMRLCT
jgi:hypothetical protein